MINGGYPMQLPVISAALQERKREFSRESLVEALGCFTTANSPGGLALLSKDARSICEKLPFEKMVMLRLIFQDTDMKTYAESFLEEAFSHLKEFDVEFHLDENSSAVENSQLGEFIKLSKESYLEAQGKFFQKEYVRLTGLRRIFAVMNRNTMMTAPDFVVPREHLFDISLAFPVWFADTGTGEGRHKRAAEIAGLMPDSVRAHMFQIYNHDLRSLTEFRSDDEYVPRNILEVMSVAGDTFDRLVIVTPYLDFVDRLWQNPSLEKRALDPEVYGLFFDKPYFIRLGAWSGSGILANKCQLMANTVAHFIRNFDHVKKYLKASTLENWFGFPKHNVLRFRYIPDVLFDATSLALGYINPGTGFIQRARPSFLDKWLNYYKK